MNLEDQVISLELAKKLKELGVKQESLFYWAGSALWFKRGGVVYSQDNEVETFEWIKNNYNDFYSAFSVAELAPLLGEELNRIKRDGKAFVWLKQVGGMGKSQYYSEGLEAKARADLLIYLLEGNLI